MPAPPGIRPGNGQGSWYFHWKNHLFIGNGPIHECRKRFRSDPFGGGNDDPPFHGDKSADGTARGSCFVQNHPLDFIRLVCSHRKEQFVVFPSREGPFPKVFAGRAGHLDTVVADRELGQPDFSPHSAGSADVAHIAPQSVTHIHHGVDFPRGCQALSFPQTGSRGALPLQDRIRVERIDLQFRPSHQFQTGHRVPEKAGYENQVPNPGSATPNNPSRDPALPMRKRSITIRQEMALVFPPTMAPPPSEICSCIPP